MVNTVSERVSRLVQEAGFEPASCNKWEGANPLPSTQNNLNLNYICDPLWLLKIRTLEVGERSRD